MPLEGWAKEQTAKQKGLAFLAKRDSFCALNTSLLTKETMGGYGKQALYVTCLSAPLGVTGSRDTGYRGVQQSILV
jgi:hypothetical protein